MKQKMVWLRPLLGLLAALLLLLLIFGKPQIWQYLENLLGQQEPAAILPNIAACCQIQRGKRNR